MKQEYPIHHDVQWPLYLEKIVEILDAYDGHGLGPAHIQVYATWPEKYLGQFIAKYGMSDDIVHAIKAHHDDIEATTPEALIVRVCDALSAARPGARNISAENFVERMRDLENVATSFDGIDKAYAISAGREVRVIVKPQNIDDLSAIKLARDIATKIESTMQYPGTIKVNVIRETRAIEFAK
jgi:ribonuclease Y